MKDMIQTQNSVTRPISRLESIMSDLINESKESLSCQPLTIFYIPNPTDWTQKSCYFGNPPSISPYQPELNQHQPLDSLANYPFPEIELEDECEPELQFSDSSPILESISTPVVLSKLSNVLEPVLIPIIPELESIIPPIHIPFVDENQDSISLHSFELAQKFENPLDILASYPFSEIELELESDSESEPQVGNSISLFDSIMTPISLSDFFLYTGVNIEFCTITPWN